MKFSEEQIKDIVALKENLIEQIEKHQKEIELLEKNLAILDLTLKESSFTKASQLGRARKATNEVPQKSEDAIPIRQGNDGRIIANAYVTPEQVAIVLDDGVKIDAETPPFKSFFLDRIIGEMKKKDAVEAENGTIQGESVIDCIINKNGPHIREITIKNYRQKERVDELINTAGWSLTRMLENMDK